jgi:hypothetical protein
MAVQGTDFLPISRAGTNYKITASDILAYINENVGTSQYDVANIAGRNALTGLSTGDRVYVTDATGDATVAAGWAIYLFRPGPIWTKVAEQESMDVIAGSATNLTYTAGASSGIVVSSDGTDATIPAVDGTNAGLALPAHKTKLDFLTVTSATDLDTIRTKVGNLTVTAATNLDDIRAASHAAVTTGGSGLTNPIVVTGQVLTFNIAGLTTAP